MWQKFIVTKQTVTVFHLLQYIYGYSHFITTVLHPPTLYHEVSIYMDDNIYNMEQHLVLSDSLKEADICIH